MHRMRGKRSLETETSPERTPSVSDTLSASGVGGSFTVEEAELIAKSEDRQERHLQTATNKLELKKTPAKHHEDAEARRLEVIQETHREILDSEKKELEDRKVMEQRLNMEERRLDMEEKREAPAPAMMELVFRFFEKHTK
eukprot:Plantae.Rhodophyta-Rhodochaete_pulchella.ctg25332.p2 GENE.Plantae.Rhodophyta-Rhodochaete_pulchella.ctg25332~~Plantae.Rhodophyta-Rhodochaete_pulchella.ctg25332.p2  ORF type:complete len:141 (+),score=32.88 Plantae.Rhodophyta-Rhodochaete_pulchella.ctg25332:501-923(+)